MSTAWHFGRLTFQWCTTVLGRYTSRVRSTVGGLNPDEVWTALGSRSLRATPVREFSATAAIESTMGAVQQLLADASVAHRLVDSTLDTPLMALGDDEWETLRSLLAEHPHSWYSLHRGRIVGGLPLLVDEGGRGVKLFRAWASPDGSYLAGPDTAITVARVSGPPAEPSSTPSPFPIDAVVTWVEGSDPRWRARRDARLREMGTLGHETATSAARWDSIDELRFMLRSVSAYAPWLRRIFLVTDGQVPPWLSFDDERIVVVDHTEIFEDPTALPTFNSHAIETQLHRIPGLAEHYIYFNDDVFLGRYLPPSTFFDASGGLRVFLAEEEVAISPVQPNDPPVVTAAKRNRELLLELTGKRLERKLKHVPHPQRRSVAEELYAAARSESEATALSPFRSPEDISFASSLLPHYALFTGRASVGRLDHFYADVASCELIWRLPELLWKRQSEIICLNATTAASSNTKRIQHFLQRYFPLASPWESSGVT